MSVTNDSTWRSACGKYTIHVRRDCIDGMVALARSHAPNEVGTSLVGAYSDDGYTATVTRLAPLAQDSRGARFSFERGARGLMAFFRKVFADSKGMVHYVGEWHSHPGGQPRPSGTDDASMFAIAKNRKALCSECLLVVLAIRGDDVRLGAFVYSEKRGRVDLMELTSET